MLCVLYFVTLYLQYHYDIVMVHAASIMDFFLAVCVLCSYYIYINIIYIIYYLGILHYHIYII